MGASVRIDADAFTDYRFDVLAQLLGLPDADCARGKMLTIWRYCTQTQRHVIPVPYAVHVLGIPGPSALIDSKLGVKHPQGIRIKGTKGRIEWLSKLRAAGHLGAKHGKKGGRPRKTPTGVITNRIEKPLEGLSQKPLPAPALVPVQDQDQPPPTPPSRTKRAGGSVCPADFAQFWEVYPRKVKKADAVKAWTKIAPDPPLFARIIAAVTAQKSWDEWTRDDGRYIPHPATWLNAQQWDDEPPQVAERYHPASATDADREREDAARRAQIAANRAKPPNIVIVGEQ